MLTTTSTIAYPSIVGHNRIHYPDTNTSLVIPEGTFLNKLSWLCESGFEAWSWPSSFGATIVWIKK